MEEANKEQKMLNDDIDENNSRIYGVLNTINALIGEVSDLLEKLSNLQNE